MELGVRRVLLVATLVLAASACAAGPEYDVVLKGGRVLDPETGFDGLRNVAIHDGRIVRITEEDVSGRDEVDVTGLVVAPGFIDMHAHGQSPETYEAQAEDGVTTVFECEVGTDQVSSWYAVRKGKAAINYGAGAGHGPARANVIIGEPSADYYPDEVWWQARLQHQDEIEGRFDEEQKAEVYRRVRNGLEDGAICVGQTPFYYINSERAEVYEVFKLAAEFGVLVSVHVRHPSILPPDSVNAVQEILANAAATGARVHFNHVHTDFLTHSPVVFDMIEGAVANGMEITTESLLFPGAGINLTMADFDYPDWQERFGYTYSDMTMAATGEVLTEETFNEYLPKARAGEMSGLMYVNLYPEWVHKMAMTHPLSVIASDSLPTPDSHPRTSGSFGRFLSVYVREKKWLELMDALFKITVLPARQFEDYVPEMAKKGRLQEGMDADITVFDPVSVRNQATYDEQALRTVGIEHVLVNGEFVVRDDEPVAGSTPGRPIRRNSASD